ncbi:MAG: DUF6377 domain-containing protein [Bacteroidales bacterium]
MRNRCQNLFRIAREYKDYQVDQGLMFAGELLTLVPRLEDPTFEKEAVLLNCELQITAGLFSDAEKNLHSISLPSVDTTLLAQYYSCKAELYTTLHQFSLNRGIQTDYEQKALRVRDSLFNLFPESPRYRAMKLADQGELDKALELLIPLAEGLNADNRNKAFIANSIANIARIKADHTLEKKYLIYAAYSDMKCGVKEYVALTNLAILLFQEKDTERAWKYMKQAHADANMSNSPLRTLQVAALLPAIDKAHREQLESEHNYLRITTILITGLLSLSLAFLLYVLFQRRNIVHKNIQLKELTCRLEESVDSLRVVNLKLHKFNEQRELYISGFLRTHALSLNKSDLYKKQLLQLLRAKELGKMENLLTDDKSKRKELEEFYEYFDSIFLDLYPDFVEEINKLLKKEERVFPPDGSLTSELRVFALIRLGMLDNAQIAATLCCSVKTIYNYRTRMRGKALSDRDLFESRVGAIGKRVPESVN